MLKIKNTVNLQTLKNYGLVEKDKEFEYVGTFGDIEFLAVDKKTREIQITGFEVLDSTCDILFKLIKDDLVELEK